jgi:hypothetical protein
MSIAYEFTAPIWLYSGEAAWHFVTLPEDVSAGLKVVRGPARGWGSIRVNASLAGVEWSTSVFPQSGSGAFLMPLKKDVRQRAGVGLGDQVTIRIEVAI